MHRFRTALLTAAAIGAGIPAIASAQMPDRRPDGERSGQRADGEQQGQRPDRRSGDQRGGQPQQAQAPQVQAQPQPQPQSQPGGDGRRLQAQGQAQQPAPQQAQSSQAYRGRRDGGGYDRPNTGFDDRGRGFAQDNRPGAYARPQGDPGRPGDPGQRGFAGGRDDRRQGFEQPRGYAGGGDPRFADGRGRDDRRPGLRAGGPQGRIGADWRGDRRYDWHGYRDQHRDVFHVGRYVPPRAYYTYGYRRFDIGFRLDRFFYASNYWIEDPSYYRLPPVWGSYRWVRYYDDVLLVDLASGEVVDVIHDFFW